VEKETKNQNSSASAHREMARHRPVERRGLCSTDCRWIKMLRNAQRGVLLHCRSRQSTQGRLLVALCCKNRDRKVNVHPCIMGTKVLYLNENSGQASSLSFSRGQASRSNIFKCALIADFMANTLRQLGKSVLAYCLVWKLPVSKIKLGY